MRTRRLKSPTEGLPAWLQRSPVGMIIALMILLPSVAMADPSASAYPMPPAGAATLEDLNSTKTAVLMKLFQDPDLKSKAFALAEDPVFKEALQDPTLMQALESGNLEAIIAHPRFHQLMKHQAVQDIKRNIM
ncbi:MAG: hypothetical protein HQL53_14690 [Magnetococcales bacterium]|nr:hypothetical protein [Magnetococcales bacterium]